MRSGPASLQRTVIHESSLENGWWNVIRNYSGRPELTLLAGHPDLFITLKATSTESENKLGQTLAILHTEDDQAVAVNRLAEPANVGKIEAMAWMSISVDVFSNVKVGTTESGFRNLARSLPEQLITVAHEWDLHVAPYLELFRKIRDYQEGCKPAQVDLGEGLTIKSSDILSSPVREQMEAIAQDHHKNYRNVAAFHLTVIRKTQSLEKLMPLQEDPSGLQKIVEELNTALAEQATKYGWDQDEIAKHLAGTL